MDVVRHAFTLNQLSDYDIQMGHPKTVAVIGDGQTNFISAVEQQT